MGGGGPEAVMGALTVDGQKKCPGERPVMVLPVTPPGPLSFKTRRGGGGGWGAAPPPWGGGVRRSLTTPRP